MSMAMFLLFARRTHIHVYRMYPIWAKRSQCTARFAFKLGGTQDGGKAHCGHELQRLRFGVLRFWGVSMFVV